MFELSSLLLDKYRNLKGNLFIRPRLHHSNFFSTNVRLAEFIRAWSRFEFEISSENVLVGSEVDLANGLGTSQHFFDPTHITHTHILSVFKRIGLG